MGEDVLEEKKQKKGRVRKMTGKGGLKREA